MRTRPTATGLVAPQTVMTSLPRAALPEVPDGLGDLAQRERSVDDGRDLAGLEALAQLFQVLRALLRDPGAQLLTDERGEQLRAKLAVDAAERLSTALSADDHQRPLAGERPPEV